MTLYILVIVLDHHTLTLRNVTDYSADNITVSVEWNQLSHAKYNIIVVPLVPMVFVGNTSRQLIIQYNTEYNLTIEAVAPCRMPLLSEDFIMVRYGPVVSVV